MAKLIVFNADTQELKMTVQKDRFLFIITDDKKMFHIDLSEADPVMYRGSDRLMELGEAHRDIVNREMILG